MFAQWFNYGFVCSAKNSAKRGGVTEPKGGNVNGFFMESRSPGAVDGGKNPRAKTETGVSSVSFGY